MLGMGFIEFVREVAVLFWPVWLALLVAFPLVYLGLRRLVRTR